MGEREREREKEREGEREREGETEREGRRSLIIKEPESGTAQGIQRDLTPFRFLYVII